MSWREVERDLKSLSADVRTLGADLGRQAGVVGDEVVAAEYLTTRSLLEWTVGWAEDGRDGVDIAVRQWRWLFEDSLATLEAASAARSVEALTALPGDHLRRRAEHLREGVDASRALAERGVRRALEPWRTVWRPFLDMVRQDWG
jgi:hypothetical protein